MKYVYILLSATPSKFGKLIRCALNERYNHMSIALDNEFKELYSFARKKNHLPLEAGFVIEDYYRFSLCKEVPLNYPPLREAKASLEVGDSFLIVLRLLKEEFGFYQFTEVCIS